MKRILITGGSGFIGTHLITYFSSLNCELLNIDIHAPKVQGQSKYWKKLDLCDFNNLHQTVIEFSPEIVVHLAARTDLRGQKLEDYDANISGVKNLLSVLDEIPSLERAIFTSSMYVCEPGYIPNSFEDYKPHTLYGQSKVLTEELIKNKRPVYCWSIIRPTSIWGPYFGEPYNLFFKMVLSKKYFHLGAKACKKSYGYVENVIYQINAILESPEEKIREKVFYLGDYKPYDITEWANEIAYYSNNHIRKIPFFFFLGAAYAGDLLKKFNIKFPMTSFRLKNMTTDNIYDLSLIKTIAPSLPYSRPDATIKTISWLKRNNGR